MANDQVDDGFEAMKAKAAGSNLDPETLLATDYLNHFNEIVMLLEMVPDMPEIMEEVKMWAPKSYCDHFRDSTIADKDIAVEAFDFVPSRFKTPFDQTVSQLDNTVAIAVEKLDVYIASDQGDLLREQAKAFSQMIQRLLDTASGIIHGGTQIMDQNEIDSIISN